MADDEVAIEQEMLRMKMDDSREALAQKIEMLEEKVTETVESATATVAEATASVMETVQNATSTVSETVDTVTHAVQGTVDSVRSSVEGTVDSVKGALDLSSQVRSHPWPMLAGAVAVGYVAGTYLQSTQRSPQPFAGRSWSENGRRGESNGVDRVPRFAETVLENRSNGYDPTAAVHETRNTAKKGPSWINMILEAAAPEVAKLQGAAIEMAAGAVKDYLAQTLPPEFKPSVTEIIDDLTEKLGGKPGTQRAPSHPTSSASSTSTNRAEVGMQS